VKDGKFAPMMSGLLARKGQAAPSVLATPNPSFTATHSQPALPPRGQSDVLCAAAETAADATVPPPDFPPATADSERPARYDGPKIYERKDKVLREAFDAYFGRAAF
jgi:hypothetical protein